VAEPAASQVGYSPPGTVKRGHVDVPRPEGAPPDFDRVALEVGGVAKWGAVDEGMSWPRRWPHDRGDFPVSAR